MNPVPPPLWTSGERASVLPNGLSFLAALFSNGHMPYEHEKKNLGLDVPTLAQMTEKAINILSAGDKGFFLLVRQTSACKIKIGFQLAR